MSEYYSGSDDEFEKQINEEENFDLYYDELTNKMNAFIQAAPYGLFERLDVFTFEEMMSGKYQPKKNYSGFLRDDLIYPKPFTYKQPLLLKKGSKPEGRLKPPASPSIGVSVVNSLGLSDISKSIQKKE